MPLTFDYFFMNLLLFEFFDLVVLCETRANTPLHLNYLLITVHHLLICCEVDLAALPLVDTESIEALLLTEVFLFFSVNCTDMNLLKIVLDH